MADQPYTRGASSRTKKEEDAVKKWEREGIGYVRPPLLKFNIIKKTKHYDEIEITTDVNAQRDTEALDAPDRSFTTDINSLIFCNPTLTIKMPKPAFMKKDGKAKFAYAFGMFPNPKNGQAAYLDGCILGALGLKRQGTLADVVCFITHDISAADKRKLEVVFDKVIYVPYLSPYDMGGSGKLKTIMMDPDIFKNCPNYTKEHPYSHVFFKLHIFNPEYFPYEKVCFVDSDLVPMNYYDSLFMLDTPAGWVEYRKKWPFQKAFHWDRCDYLEHGGKIPKIFTDTGDPGASDVNAGLMLVKPDKKEYASLLAELTSPVSRWMGPGKLHKGFYDMDFSGKSLAMRKFVPNSYCYPEQNYLTKRYSGKWTYIEYAFQSWTLDPCNSFGIHMAAFNPKPWFKQPANTEVKMRDSPQPYFYENLSEIFVSEIPKAVTPEDLTMVLENISISYELFNNLSVWGLVQYPELHKFFMHDTKIYGTKLSFGDDIFLPLSKDDEFRLLKDFRVGDKDYKKLSISQQYIVNLMNDYTRFVKKMDDKFLSVCRTKLMDRDGQYKYDFQIIDYKSEAREKSSTEAKMLLQKGLVPSGRDKGLPIGELTEDKVRHHASKKPFNQFKGLREALRKYHPLGSTLVGPETYYASAQKRRKRNLSRRKKGKAPRSTTSRPNKKPKVIYFYMDECDACKGFKKTWTKVKKLKGFDFDEIDGPKNRDMALKYGVTSYPALVKVVGQEDELFKANSKADRSFKKIEEFLKSETGALLHEAKRTTSTGDYAMHAQSIRATELSRAKAAMR